ncbi:MAG: hypothetical protein GOVbin4691_30 [Prokaryotic dsDNA virus sp.]|nr:hypothetical protein [Candidatus Pacearchaeota archaeon]QDP52538.1 MAG: hypothetical protein GOVbin4691_30 [Prokaryotic dsDNA virus sp.]|tara:strand:+ start:1660 stop:2106 length:447 start_codon:yes stop_codon:yes gene_type:complete
MSFIDFVFTEGQKITATIMGQLDGNLDAIAEGAESSPRIPRPLGWVQFCGYSGNNERGVYANPQGIVSSLTVSGVADYTITFTNPMSDTNYGCANAMRSNAPIGDVSVRACNASTLTTTTARFRMYAANASASGAEDADFIYAVFYQY